MHAVRCSVIPYVNTNGCKLLPLPVVTNAAGLLSDCATRLGAMSRHLKLVIPTIAQRRFLNQLCSDAGLQITFDSDTPLVDLQVVCSLSNPVPYTQELPATRDPFTHAQFIGGEAVAMATTTRGGCVAPANGGIIPSWHTATTECNSGAAVVTSGGGHQLDSPVVASGAVVPSQPTNERLPSSLSAHVSCLVNSHTEPWTIVSTCKLE